jgi:hypothetical protein
MCAPQKLGDFSIFFGLMSRTFFCNLFPVPCGLNIKTVPWRHFALLFVLGLDIDGRE